MDVSWINGAVLVVFLHVSLQLLFAVHSTVNQVIMHECRTRSVTPATPRLKAVDPASPSSAGIVTYRVAREEKYLTPHTLKALMKLPRNAADARKKQKQPGSAGRAR